MRWREFRPRDRRISLPVSFGSPFRRLDRQPYADLCLPCLGACPLWEDRPYQVDPRWSIWTRLGGSGSCNQEKNRGGMTKALKDHYCSLPFNPPLKKPNNIAIRMLLLSKIVSHRSANPCGRNRSSVNRRQICPLIWSAPPEMDSFMRRF